MRIAWFCIPAYGHTNPTLALVKEIVCAGHEVFYFSFNKFRDRIEETGATFISCDDCALNIDEGKDGNRAGKDLAFSIRLIVESALAMDELVDQHLRVMRPDLIVSDSMAYGGKLSAMKYKIPYVCSNTTFAFNRYSAKYMDQGIGGLFAMLFSLPKITKQLKRLREKGYPVKNFLELISNDNNTSTIVYTSKEFQPYAETFSDKYCFIGPSIRPLKVPMKKTAKKTVYISMGTVISNEVLYRSCVDALKGSDCQVIISLGESRNDFTSLPDNFQIYDFVDQMAVLNIADAFVTHCGMNSVSEGLYFKVPLILVPQTPEQMAVARRTEELKAGVMLKESERTSDNIRNAINTVLQDPSYKEAAARISAGFRNSGGVRRAREFLESIAENN